jgi:hypothetical protein
LDKLEEVCQQYPGGAKFLNAFFAEFVKKVPPKRGSDPSPYAIRMHERAIAFIQGAEPADAGRRVGEVAGGDPGEVTGRGRHVSRKIAKEQRRQREI